MKKTVKSYRKYLVNTMILLKGNCECKHLGFKFAKHDMNFVNKQLPANQ